MFEPDMLGIWKVKASCGGEQYYSGTESLQKIFKVIEQEVQEKLVDEDTPGFELLSIIVALVIVPIVLKRRKA